MSETTEDGGPAFPVQSYTNMHGYTFSPDLGMSLRDWFAGMAINHLISLSQDSDGGWSPENVAFGCYALADAMLKARKG